VKINHAERPAVHILRVDCPDRKGLVRDITDVLYTHGLNIEKNGEYVDRNNGHFFMRTEFSGAFDSGDLHARLKERLAAGANILLTTLGRKKMVVMATHEHHCLSDLLVRNYFDEMNAVIQAVISNHDQLRSVSERLDVPYHFVSHENLSREAHEERITKILQQYNPDYIVLARYMRVLSEDFTSQWPNRIINIHHSFLPAFIGASPYRQAHERGVKIIGATAHFVNSNLDEGPIIAQNVINVSHSQTVEELSEAGRDVEKTVLARAIKLVLEEKVMVHGNRTVIFE
jgi:formyltetrahydrofolate deformylase